MLYARCCAARIRTRASGRSTLSKARALPGVKAILTHENCQVVWGAGSVAGGQQYNDEIKKITKQRRYAFNNPVRFVGEPVAAVAAVDRHVAEEALPLIAVDYEVLPFVLDQEEALKPGAPQIWPEGNLVAEQPQRGAADRPAPRQRRRRRSPTPTTSSRIATRPRSCTTRRWSRAPCVAHWERRQADRLHADRRHRQLPPRHGPRPRHPRQRRSASSASTWAATSATRTRTRTPI